MCVRANARVFVCVSDRERGKDIWWRGRGETAGRPHLKVHAAGREEEESEMGRGRGRVERKREMERGAEISSLMPVRTKDLCDKSLRDRRGHCVDLNS